MKVAVVCAYPAGLNPGMLSVDLAFDTLRAQVSKRLQVTRFCIEGAGSVTGGGTRLDYSVYRDVRQLDDFDAVVFWGDFIHWIGYAENDVGRRAAARVVSPDGSVSYDVAVEAIERWYRLCLLEGETELQKRSILFGGSVCGLNAGQLSNLRYRNALRSLFQRARLVLMRDLLSANFASELGSWAGQSFGCDCALLLPDGFLGGARRVEPRGQLGFSFGRTGGHVLLMSFARAVADCAGVSAHDVQWLSGSGLDGLHSKVAAIKACSLVVTDVYHMAVTALREGIPTLCVGRGSQEIETTLSDKKKEVLFAQLGILNRYVYFETLHDAAGRFGTLKSVAEKYLKRLRDFEATAILESTLQYQVTNARSRLLAALQA